MKDPFPKSLHVESLKTVTALLEADAIDSFAIVSVDKDGNQNVWMMYHEGRVNPTLDGLAELTRNVSRGPIFQEVQPPHS